MTFRTSQALTLLPLVLSLSACSSSTTDESSPTDASHPHSDVTAPSDSGRQHVADATKSGSEDAPGPSMFDGPLKDAGVFGDAASPRYFQIENRCTFPVWAAALPATTLPGGHVELAPGATFQAGIDNGWSGRVWGKVDCVTNNGNFACASDPFPSSLAELTLTNMVPSGLDFYDVSLVDGFNLPIEIVALGHTPDPSQPYNCGSPQCTVNLNATCASVFQDKADAEVLACANDECKVLGNNDAASPACIYPNQYTRFFKTPCPTAYSFPSDDPTSTFTCKGLNNYQIVFCP